MYQWRGGCTRTMIENNKLKVLEKLHFERSFIRKIYSEDRITGDTQEE